MITFGDWLRSKRSRAGLTGKELAQRAGISQQYLTDLEHGRRAATYGLLYRLASVLDVSFDVACLRAGRLPADLVQVEDIGDSAYQQAADALRAVLKGEQR